jgi:hypothetical protein
MSAQPLGRIRGDDGARTGDDRPPAPFVVGLTRSGTTLLRMMLDAHPQLTIPPETHFVPDLIKAARAEQGTDGMLAALTGNRTWGDFGISAEEMRERLGRIHSGDGAEAVRAFFDAYAKRQGKPRWRDQTPAYMLAVQRIGRTLPESRFIHLIRDGRDVALSQSARAINEQPPPAEQAARWVKRIRKSRDQAATLKGPRYVEARYEDLVRDPEGTLRRVCEFIDLPWDPAVLAYHERAAERLTEMAGELRADGSHATQEAGYRIDNHAPTTRPPDPSKLDKWKAEMTSEDIAAYESVAGELLKELGYEVAG